MSCIGPIKEIRLLSRVITWENGHIRWEADQRHAEIIVSMLALHKMNVRAEIPGETINIDEGDEEPLDAQGIKKYQALVARSNYLT